MTEEFLHYIWKYQLFDHRDLRAVTGEKISVVKAGIHNTDSGPDFFDARIKIDQTLWAGNVEIHIHSSSWKKHNHQQDHAYDNVILHVVYENDDITVNAGSQPVLTLALKNKFDQGLYNRYSGFIHSHSQIACENLVSSVDELVRNNWLGRLAAERLERKSAAILQDLKTSDNDWAEVFHICLARNFGLKVNTEPFAMLARSLPLSLLGRHKDNLYQVEALLFGQAGFLEDDFKEEYPLSLKREFEFLQKKYSLVPMDIHLWKFHRLRPSGFPTLRISQYANLFCGSGALFSKIIESDHVEDVIKLFRVSASAYWDTHYTFEPVHAEQREKKKNPTQKKKLGENAVNAIVINTVVPFLFVYGKQKADPTYQERALKFLEQLPPEYNVITKGWQKLGFENNSAFDSQAQMELRNEYCRKKKCLDCAIGGQLLR